jgi:hypothetical protein
VRAHFARLQQAVAVLSIEKLPELYSLGFPQPLLSRADICHLLQRKKGLLRAEHGTSGGADLAAVCWDKVPVKQF